MKNDKSCPHRLAVNSIICKCCGQPQCDLCIKEHLAFHIENNDKEIRWEDME
ncbi:hypothetical protein [Nitrosopumilus sp.]|uniref:hypothetical protein n=1 Tax=Nitrosopumilus sp. TaxID=2024843 RepID=UPI003B5CFAA4